MRARCSLLSRSSSSPRSFLSQLPVALSSLGAARYVARRHSLSPDLRSDPGPPQGYDAICIAEGLGLETIGTDISSTALQQAEE